MHAYDVFTSCMRGCPLGGKPKTVLSQKAKNGSFDVNSNSRGDKQKVGLLELRKKQPGIEQIKT